MVGPALARGGRRVLPALPLRRRPRGAAAVRAPGCVGHVLHPSVGSRCRATAVRGSFLDAAPALRWFARHAAPSRPAHGRVSLHSDRVQSVARSPQPKRTGRRRRLARLLQGWEGVTDSQTATVAEAPAQELTFAPANPLECSAELKALFLAHERPEFPAFFD